MYKLIIMGATFALGLGLGKFLKKKQELKQNIQNS